MLSPPCSTGLTRLERQRAGIFRPRGLSVWTLNRTCQGEGRFVCADGSFHTALGDLVLVEPGVVNDYGAAPDHLWHHQWAVFQPEEGWAELLAWPLAGAGHRLLRRQDSATDAALDQLFSQTIGVSQGLHPRRHEAALALVRALLTLAAPWRGTPAASPDGRLQRAMAAVVAEPWRPWSIAELAAVADLSASRFAHRFRTELGMSPRQWLERRRIRLAADRLLMSGAAVAEIARAVGFTDAAYFTLIFRRLTGTTPSRWRRSPGLPLPPEANANSTRQDMR